MKVLLMWEDNLIRVVYIDKLKPEMKIPAKQVFNIPSSEKTEVVIISVFKLMEHGGNCAIYQLDGFENKPTTNKE